MKQLVLATLGLITAALPAQAQVSTFGQRPTRPVVNPFLPGGRSGSALTPQQADTLRLLGQQLQPGGTLGQAVVDPTLGQTGHPVRFFYYSHYYTFPFPRVGPSSTGGGLRPPLSQSQLSNQGRDFGMAPPPAGIGILITP